MIEAFKSLLDNHKKVTVLTHIGSNGDGIGTALGLYGVLKSVGKQVEICASGGKGAKYLDFLPHFAKIKNQMDFDDSLIISCDLKSVDLVVFDLSSRVIVNIDHHASNTNYGTLNIVDGSCVSSSQVAYNFLKNDFKITKETATCFYVALVRDTHNFTTCNVGKEVFDMALQLISYEINLEEIRRNLTQRNSLSSLRVLEASLNTLELYEEAKIASMLVTQNTKEQTGATLDDMRGLIDYAMNLATVQIAILVIELPEHLKVSLQSSGHDISALANFFGGEIHGLSAEFFCEKINIKLLLNQMIDEIKERGLIDET